LKWCGSEFGGGGGGSIVTQTLSVYDLGSNMDDSLSFSGLKGLWAPILVSHPKGGTIVVILVLLQVPELSLRPVCVRARARALCRGQSCAGAGISEVGLFLLPPISKMRT